MGWVISAGILALASLIAFTANILSRDPYDKRAARTISIVSGALAILVFFIGTITIVGANKVGVVMSFGQYKGIVHSGPHLMAPWKNVDEFGTRIQPLEMTDTPIRFSGNSGGDIDTLTEWRITSTDDVAVERLWKDYRTFENVENRLVRANVGHVVNVVMAEYEPGSGIDGRNRQAATDAMRTKINERLVGTGVTVDRLTIIHIQPDRGSQDRIDKQVQALADKQTAVTQAETAKIRTESSAAADKELECLRIAQDWNVAIQGPMPPLFCSFGNSAPVVVGQR